MHQATVQRPSARTVCEMSLAKTPARVHHMRPDALALLLTLANIGPHARVWALLAYMYTIPDGAIICSVTLLVRLKDPLQSCDLCESSASQRMPSMSERLSGSRHGGAYVLAGSTLLLSVVIPMPSLFASEVQAPLAWLSMCQLL